jgi:hypothetical protein
MPVIIFAILVALIAVPLGLWRLKEARRPVLEEVRIVTAAGDDPVFRDGLRRVAPGADVRIAAALRISRVGGADSWIAPVDLLEIGDRRVEHQKREDWPDRDRVVRVFWFTLESAYLGGDMTPDRVEKLLEQRSYLAPEMGRGLLATRFPEQHNDDQINLGDENLETAGGTIRLYARVEVATRVDAVSAEQSAASLGSDAVDDPRLTSLRLSATFPEPVRPVLGELFRLPGFEPQPAAGELWEDITEVALGASFRDLVDRRFLASSRTFASVALTGTSGMDPGGLVSLGRVTLNTDPPERAGRPLGWGGDVRSGDLLEDRGQWIVLLADDGDGTLGPEDRVTHCWRRPAVVTTLDRAVRDDAVEGELFRHEL